MSFSLNLSAGPKALPPSPGLIVARIGPSPTGTVGDVDQWDNGQDQEVATELGACELADWTAKALQSNGQRCVTVVANASISGDYNTSNQTGTWPGEITLTDTGAPSIDCSFALEVIQAGPLGVARAQYSFDGGQSWAGAFTLPAQLPATVVGTMDLTTITLSNLNAKVLNFTPDGGAEVGVTFSSVTTIAGIVTQVQTAAGANATVFLVAGKYLGISGITLGNSGTILVGTANANSLLGFTASPTDEPTEGPKYDWTVPGIGLVLTFPAGTYVVGAEFTINTVATRMSIADVNAALVALRASGVPFARIVLTQVPLDGQLGGGADLLSFAAALHTFCASVRASQADRIYPTAILGGPLGTPGTSGVAANDSDVNVAFTGYVSDYVTIAHGDIYADSSVLTGRMRRSLAQMLTEQMGSRALSTNVGYGAVPDGYYMQTADTVTSARDENYATTKMQPNGFTVAVRQDGLPKFLSGTTRSASGSKLAFLNLNCVGWEGMRLVYAQLTLIDLADIDLNDNGTIQEQVAKSYEKIFNNVLKVGLINPGYVSGASTAINRAVVVLDDGTYPMQVTFSVQVKGQLTNITGTVALVSTVAELS